MISYQHLDQLKELYILKATGTHYVDPIVFNSPTLVDASNSLPQNLKDLHKLISKCYLCDLSKSRHEVQVFHGSIKSGLMIVSDFPSLAQDSNGPFAGKSGEMIQNMIEKVLGLSVEDVYFTHTVKCMPQAGTTPKENESKSCQAFYNQQIKLLKPKLILCLGSFSYNLLTEGSGSFNQDKGVIMPFGQSQLIAIEHPQILVQNPEAKKETMQELKQIKSYLCEN